MITLDIHWNSNEVARPKMNIIVLALNWLREIVDNLRRFWGFSNMSVL